MRELVQGLDFKDYLAYDAISSSGIVQLRRSPAHYQEYLKQTDDETPAKLLGKQIHAAILELDKFKNFVVMPEKFDRRKKLGREEYDNFMAENHEKTIVSFDNFKVIEGVLEACYKHITLSKLLRGGKNEASCFWQDHLTGVNCKARFDKLLDNDVIIDIKTTEDASLNGFKKSISKYLYHIQSAFYLEALSVIRGKALNDFVHVAIEKTPPYGIGIYTLDDVSLAAGSDEIRKHLEIYSECKKNNNWPCYKPEVQNISIPTYLLEVRE